MGKIVPDAAVTAESGRRVARNLSVFSDSDNLKNVVLDDVLVPEVVEATPVQSRRFFRPLIGPAKLPRADYKTRVDGSAQGLDAEGYNQALQLQFLRIVTISGLVWATVMQLPLIFGQGGVTSVHGQSNFAFMLHSIAIYCWAVRWPKSFRVAAVAYFAGFFLYAAAAQFWTLADSLRMLLFFPIVGAIFLIVGSVAAWILVIAAVAVLGMAAEAGAYAVTPTGFGTFALTLCGTGLLFQTFQHQTRKAIRVILQQNAALEEAAQRDHLTQLLNLMAMREIMQKEADALLPGEAYSVAFVDVDRFKSINDRYGHAVGDAVLTAVAKRLEGAVRKEDAVARIGGEEFAILFPKTDQKTAALIAERVRQAVACDEIAAGGHRLRITVSIGLAEERVAGGPIDALLHLADSAMYEAKNSGRNCLVLA